ncbi:aspartate/glutamate racemase family protein [Streptomyces sp. CBMA152]|uniref:aspartate/glutamate racemase family protein n=1 Tax=Streptomyces sp. CBMA152 TaxID=1896312 RepID=UPI001660186E|nr:aspartate/glutamate racemase family protein [Streptomyces sp. CBMA152]MBD0741769.1 arylsulfatase [Streptomyces sp. CBMA152]
MADAPAPDIRDDRPQGGELTLLHTAMVHVPVFDGLRDEDHPGLELRHLVYPELLGRAQGAGPSGAAEATKTVLGEAVAEGATAVLCTCSTIGAIAEAAGAELGVPVLRVDRPMAVAAVAYGPRVVVIAALESTVASTTTLLHEEAARAGREVSPRIVLLDRAWKLFESGDPVGYHWAVAEAIEAVEDVDAIVLAQASMTPATELVPSKIPVLTSPRMGLAAAARLV